ncbi:hypothetical protein M2139_002325 [Enterococcus sp. PF1-24]|uniref:hypothetical protein n=1 Tax=unclassified Enterococcus TaxID=2608891 RepID=UPI00247468E7|nr:MULTISPECIES: hypothetical protein [unclassified Enterococcus]MDH6365320.1 hypothetical protein [Enterococcus sp. PFB1-1]MDH6402424.1 hypothetical protein [Enterococcus sp. PF1-24]
METDSLDKVLEESAVLTIDTSNLLLLFVITVVVSFALSKLLKNQYNPKQLIISYACYGIFHLLLGIFILKLSVIIVLGLYLMGGILAFFRSNHYFYQQ